MTVLQENKMRNANAELQQLAQRLLLRGRKPGTFMWGYENMKESRQILEKKYKIKFNAALSGESLKGKLYIIIIRMLLWLEI